MIKNNMNNKMFLLSLKYLPIVLSMGIFVGIILYMSGIRQPITSGIAGGSILVNINLYFGSRVFKFCRWHRILIYYNMLYALSLMINYYCQVIPDVYDFIDYTSIISIIVFIIAYINRNKK